MLNHEPAQMACPTAMVGAHDVRKTGDAVKSKLVAKLTVQVGTNCAKSMTSPSCTADWCIQPPITWETAFVCCTSHLAENGIEFLG